MLPFGIDGRINYAPQPQAYEVAQVQVAPTTTPVIEHKSPKCKAIAIKSGNRCKKYAQKPSQYCEVHRKVYEKTHKVE
tara:strand:- start:247 stop:480 length:234 start_codon:yes stop_codon:yes gene_type:complete